jgi:hypothetical protein
LSEMCGRKCLPARHSSDTYNKEGGEHPSLTHTRDLKLAHARLRVHARRAGMALVCYRAAAQLPHCGAAAPAVTAIRAAGESSHLGVLVMRPLQPRSTSTSRALLASLADKPCSGFVWARQHTGASNLVSPPRLINIERANMQRPINRKMCQCTTTCLQQSPRQTRRRHVCLEL